MPAIQVDTNQAEYQHWGVKVLLPLGAFVHQTNQLGETATYSVTALITAEHALQLTAQPGMSAMSIDVSQAVFHT